MPIPVSIKQLILKKDVSVTNINLSNWGIDDNDITELVELLNTNPHIKKLNLYRNDIGQGAKLLINLLYVDDVNLSYNAIMDSVIEKLANSRIPRLDLSRNLITDVGGEILAEHSKQIYLKLDNTKITEGIMHKIKAKVEENNKESIKVSLSRALPNGNGTSHDHHVPVNNTILSKKP